VIRAFLAVDLEPQALEQICRATDGLRERIPSIRWVPKENLHLTVKFLGNIEETRVTDIAVALRRQLSPFSRFRISAKGLGVFPERGRPKILWVGLTGKELTELATNVESCLLPLGFAPEQRSFTPHLTIGRWRQFDRPPGELKQELENWRGRSFGESSVNEVILFRSELNPAGSIYRRLEAFALGKLS
jgi:RNA 2',3'-cyclic 3'-phosphodiesterase